MCIDILAMVGKFHLLNQLIRIELHNLNGICPLIYTIDNNKRPLENHYFTDTNKFIQNNDTTNPIHFSRVYIITGYNTHIRLLTHIKKKYAYLKV